MPPLPHCTHRHVSVDGAILCDRIKQADREVNPDLCRTCPVATINCALLRATLTLHSRPPIRVRYGNGKTDIWPGEDPSVTLGQAACSEKMVPIFSSRDCAGCCLRQSISQPVISTPALRVTAVPAIRSSTVAPATHPARPPRPIIQFAAYLEKENAAGRFTHSSAVAHRREKKRIA